MATPLAMLVGQRKVQLMPKVSVPWSVPKDLWERLTSFARDRGVSRSRVVERALEEFFLYHPDEGLAKEPHGASPARTEKKEK